MNGAASSAEDTTPIHRATTHEPLVLRSGVTRNASGPIVANHSLSRVEEG
jgi:hypothetical protein